MSGQARKHNKIGPGGHPVFRIGPDFERNLGLYDIKLHAEFQMDWINSF